MRFSRIGFPLLLAAVVVLSFGATLWAADEPEGEEEAAKIETKEDAAKARPERRGRLTYRERINTVAREPLRKEVPKDNRTPEERQYRGIRDATPLVARKQTHPPRPRLSRLDHVLQVARGPIRRPPKEKE